MVLLVLGAWAGGARPAAGAPESTNADFSCTVTLADGSRLLGQPRARSLRVRTAFAEVDVLLAQVVRVQFVPEADTVEIRLRNGDRLSGTASLASLELQTIFGPVRIGREHLRAIDLFGQPSARGLVLHYSFDDGNTEAAADASGNGNVGRPHRLALADGVRAQAAVFNGPDSYIVVEEKSAFRRDVFSVCAWVRCQGTGEIADCIAAKGNTLNGAEGRGFFFHLTSAHERGGVRFGVADGQNDHAFAESPRSVADGQWHFVCGVSDGQQISVWVDGQQISVWVDGQQEARTPFRGPIAWNDSLLTIGRNSSAPAGYWDQL